MNVFVESLVGYLIEEWERALNTADGPKEARFILQSLAPENALALFSALDGHRLKWLQSKTLECHFRVATGLWKAWNPAATPALNSVLAKLLQHGWVDEKDQLTWYRNRTRPADKDGLVVVLLGLDHASDQGGLADFHRVDEQRVWQAAMGRSFEGWIRAFDSRHSLEASDREIERFDEVLQQLFKVRPQQLAKLAVFLDRVADGGGLYTLAEFVQRFYQQLPFWGIPPLLNVPGGKKGIVFLKDAEAFIAHQRLKTPSEQKKAWGKLTQAFADGRLELPEEIDADEPVYADLKDFQATLQAFIVNADADAKAKLLRADLLPVLQGLKGREAKPKSNKQSIPKLSGLSLEVMLQAVWHTLSQFQQKYPHQPLADTLAAVRVVLTHFKHDLADDDEAGLDGKELARAMLQGCLGGLDTLFGQIDWRLPVDAEQALLPRGQWEKAIPLELDLSLARDLNTTGIGVSRKRPHVLLRVELAYADGANLPEPEEDEDDKADAPGQRCFKWAFRWEFGPTQPERVRYQCAKAVLDGWESMNPGRWMLPAFRLSPEHMTALYFATDADEANRLVAQALSKFRLIDLLADLRRDSVEAELRERVGDLSHLFHCWLKYFVEQGYYAADAGYFDDLSKAYQALAKAVLDTGRLGSSELLRRLYKAFLLIDGKAHPNDDYLRSAVAWGVSLPVVELDHYRLCFLRDSFPEVACELALGHDGKAAFGQLLKLVELHRPLAGLVVDETKKLSAKIKSFGLLHCLGEHPSTERSLAVQTLLREEENDDDEDIADLLIQGEESGIVSQVLRDYQDLYPFAQDGLRILGVHVKELATVLAGVDRFLRDYLDRSSDDWPAFHCQVTVYTTSSSPMVMENRLMAWREAVMASCREQGRALLLSVGHRYAPTRDRMIEMLRQEARQYDVAFLFHFLEGELAGEVEAALKFAYDYNPANISPFPICEYPRPIQQGDVYRRQTLLSNRRLRLQTRHADLSARLRQPQNTHEDHVIFGLVNFEPWQPVVEELHRKAQWVACIDPFVDKNLLCGSEPQERRKIVGFASGLGDYGELNLTVSTEQDTLKRLAELVRGQLDGLLPFQQPAKLEAMAARVVGEAEAIIGLSSLHAVVGEGEKIREVVGFAAIRRALAWPTEGMAQLLPVDALTHWFADSESPLRPDLLAVSLTVREDAPPLIQAVVVECKFAQHNPAHLLKAFEQVRDGLSHLTQLFAPNRPDIARMGFDRRYWWAQLQRAITSRSLVNLADAERRKLDRALESVADGNYEIAWQGAIFTFWTDQPDATPELTPLALPANALKPPFALPEGFAVWHLALGYEGLAGLFGDKKATPLLRLDDKPAIRTRAQESPPVAAAKIAVAVEPSPADQSTVAPAPFTPSLPPAVSAPTVPPVVAVPAASPFAVEAKPPAPSAIESSQPSHAAPVIVLPTVPERLLIGTRGNGEPVYWHYGHPQLNNRHLLIFGASGSGKTYGIQCLLAEMARQRLHSLIVDYTDGFLPQQTEPLFREIAKPKDQFLKINRLPLNPFRRQCQLIDPSQPKFEETANDVATRVANIFSSIFEIGEQQFPTLIRAIRSGIEQNPAFGLDNLLPSLEADDSTYGETLARKLEPLVMAQPFTEGENSAWDQMLADPKCWVQVLQLKGLAREIQKMVTEFALWDLYDYASNNGNQKNPIPIVLDEIQNLDHRSDSPIDKMLREGRKFGLSLILATQTTSQFNQEQRDRLFQAGHKLFFRPADTEIGRFAELLSQKGKGISKSEWSQKLSSLQKGQCWSLGPILTSSGVLKEEAVLVSVTALEKRQFEEEIHG